MRLAEVTARRLDALLARDQAAGRLPSVVAGVVRDGALAWSGARGTATGVVDGAPTDRQYRIGSITKTLVAVLVLQLRDEGAVDLNDPLERHLPGICFGTATLRGLLSHATGMPSEPAGPWWERNPGRPFEELAAGLADAEPVFPPGATYHYTNTAFGLLGEMVARLRGEGWWDQARRRILEPLGMHRTTYLPEAPAATGYSVHPYAGTLTEEPAHDAGAMAPAGQVWSTVEDLARYAGFLTTGHDAVLAPATVAELASPQSASREGAASGGYGLGLRLAYRGGRTLVGHTGSMPGFMAGLFVDRERRTGAVVLTNATTGLRAEGLPLDLLAAVEELEPSLPEPWVPSAAVPAPVAEVLGVWHWGNTGYVFAWEAGEVVVRPIGERAASHRFAPRPDGSLVGTAGYHNGERLAVVRRPDGSVSHLTCATFVYTRHPYEAP